MYYAARDPATPRWARTTLYGALGYFIVPLDAIPDITPLLGYSDDLGVLVFATLTVASHITDAHKQNAQEAFPSWQQTIRR